MNRNQKINLISILLAISGVVMVILGIQGGIAPPTVTGIGFFITVWGLQVLK